MPNAWKLQLRPLEFRRDMESVQSVSAVQLLSERKRLEEERIKLSDTVNEASLFCFHQEVGFIEFDVHILKGNQLFVFHVILSF